MQSVYNVLYVDMWSLCNIFVLVIVLACMCNKHAEDCYYNQTLMSAVCINCGDNTTGEDCSACLPSFYKTSLIPSDPNLCQCERTNMLAFLNEVIF